MLVPDAHVSWGRRNVQDERDVLDIKPNNPSASTSQISSATGPSQSAIWLTLWENQLYPFPVKPVQGLNPREKHLCLQFS
jgi:hypothetical protein